MTITEPDVARTLVELKTVQLLEPFMKREVSLSEAAAELNVKLPTLLYHVNKFIELGLLEVARVERRAGRPIKHYRTTAKAFFVPFDVTPSETLAHLMYRMISPGEQRFHREAAQALQNHAGSWGVYMYCNQGEGVSYALTSQGEKHIPTAVSTMLKQGAPALFVSDGTLELDFETAKALQKDLADLYARYNKKQRTGGQLYAYRLGLTPVQDETLDT